jgi:hypothetical protein
MIELTQLISDFDAMRDLFGSRPGSVIATRTTYLPTGKLIDIYRLGITRYLSVWGSRTFPAAEFDDMVAWMKEYCPHDLLALEIVELDLLR